MLAVTLVQSRRFALVYQVNAPSKVSTGNVLFLCAVTLA